MNRRPLWLLVPLGAAALAVQGMRSRDLPPPVGQEVEITLRHDSIGTQSRPLCGQLASMDDDWAVLRVARIVPGRVAKALDSHWISRASIQSITLADVQP